LSILCVKWSMCKMLKHSPTGIFNSTMFPGVMPPGLSLKQRREQKGERERQVRRGGLRHGCRMGRTFLFRTISYRLTSLFETGTATFQNWTRLFTTFESSKVTNRLKKYIIVLNNVFNVRYYFHNNVFINILRLSRTSAINIKNKLIACHNRQSRPSGEFLQQPGQ